MNQAYKFLGLHTRYITVLQSVEASNSDLAKPVRFGPWFELDWAGRPNHSMVARHVVLAERKLTTYVYAVGKLPTGNV
ncbi:hypothetical protein TIFTF001_045446 [Ficus carica]|uniref:Uncharacterized protein n=1 Tax=Ficus carica TaxID=3494 RepID=A0AA87YQX9_FICCA|nr:hypothetical protein TIFTF001_045442 [Ficus carica]GMN21151.1 hypothetical protein TIFTF001_045446 [Ficus carica]